MMNESKQNYLNSIIEELPNLLKMQDNLATAIPLFCVQQKRRIYNIDDRATDNFIWVDKDGEDVDYEFAEELEKRYNDIDDSNFTTEYIGKIMREFKTIKDYLELLISLAKDNGINCQIDCDIVTKSDVEQFLIKEEYIKEELTDIQINAIFEYYEAEKSRIFESESFKRAINRAKNAGVF